MGGKGGFGRQLKKMGREFRLQREVERKQQNRVAVQQQKQQQEAEDKLQQQQDGNNKSNKQPPRRNFHKAAPLQGVYRDLSGRRILVVDNKNQPSTNEAKSLTKNTGNQQDENGNIENEILDSVYKKQQIETAAREIVIDERKNLIKKIIAAAREGAGKISCAQKNRKVEKRE